jgi:hypothetical protein
MSYIPFLGLMNLETQNMRKWRGKGVKSGKYLREWYDDPSRIPPNSNPFPEDDPHSRIPCQPPK